jgi:hypothetical protein
MHKNCYLLLIVCLYSPEFLILILNYLKEIFNNLLEIFITWLNISLYNSIHSLCLFCSLIVEIEIFINLSFNKLFFVFLKPLLCNILNNLEVIVFILLWEGLLIYLIFWLTAALYNRYSVKKEILLSSLNKVGLFLDIVLILVFLSEVQLHSLLNILINMLHV